MLARLTEAIAKIGINITQIEAETGETRRGQIETVVELKDSKQLQKLIREVRALPGVLKVDRRMSAAGAREKAFG